MKCPICNADNVVEKLFDFTCPKNKRTGDYIIVKEAKIYSCKSCKEEWLNPRHQDYIDRKRHEIEKQQIWDFQQRIIDNLEKK